MDVLSVDPMVGIVVRSMTTVDLVQLADPTVGLEFTLVDSVLELVFAHKENYEEFYAMVE